MDTTPSKQTCIHWLLLQLQFLPVWTSTKISPLKRVGPNLRQKGPAIQSAFKIASKILRQDAAELLRRMTGDELRDRPTYREIFSNPWVVQGWNEIKDVQHYDVTKSISLKQQSLMIDLFKAYQRFCLPSPSIVTKI
mmetsp:Transcript_13791/g.33234  ORF Transcript_13791/g.33234 Transcript_13791/m.33234 type:complete len:137 (-) Transcript_13791:45-455(-)